MRLRNFQAHKHFILTFCILIDVIFKMTNLILILLISYIKSDDNCTAYRKENIEKIQQRKKNVVYSRMIFQFYFLDFIMYATMNL